MQNNSSEISINNNENVYIFAKTNIINQEDVISFYKKQADSISCKYLFLNFKKYNNILIYETDYKNLKTSIFKNHSLKTNSINQHPFNYSTTDWLLLLVFILISFFSYNKYHNKKRFYQILKATISNRSINQLNRDGDIFKERISLVLTILYLLSFSLFVFLLLHYFYNLKNLDFFNLKFYIKILLVITALFVIKFSVTRFVGFIFKNNNASSYYNLNNFIFNFSLGVFLLPINIFILYSNKNYSSFFVIFGAFFLLIISIIKFYRAVVIGVSFSKFSNYYLFLYLCTLEILPLLILLKISIGLINKYL